MGVQAHWQIHAGAAAGTTWGRSGDNQRANRRKRNHSLSLASGLPVRQLQRLSQTMKSAWAWRQTCTCKQELMPIAQLGGVVTVNNKFSARGQSQSTGRIARWGHHRPITTPTGGHFERPSTDKVKQRITWPMWAWSELTDTHYS